MAGNFLLKIKAQLCAADIAVFVEVAKAEQQCIDKRRGKGAASGYFLFGVTRGNELAYRQAQCLGDVGWFFG